MNIVNVYHLRDPYNFAEGYHHINQYYNASPDIIKSIIDRQEKFFKHNDVAGYLVDILEVHPTEGEPVHTFKMRTGTEKQKIILNPRAKRDPSKPRTLAADLNVAINAIAAQPNLGNANDVWVNWAHPVEEELP